MIPRPKIGESQGTFINRCVKELIFKGTPEQQAVEICMGRWTKISDPLLPTEFKEATVLHESVYFGQYFDMNKLYSFTYKNIGGSVAWGYGLPSDFDINSQKWKVASDFKANVEFFSGAKTKNEVKELNEAIFNSKGQKVPFNEFRDIAKGINSKYNINYLKTEMNQAFIVAQQKERWEIAQDEKKIFPYLQYQTVGDARVRPEHRIWDGVIKRVDDPFWNTHYPPNDWSCRCITVQLREGIETTDKDRLTPNDDSYWNGNVGKGTQVFKKTGIPYKEKPTPNEFRPIDDLDVKQQMPKIWD